MRMWHLQIKCAQLSGHSPLNPALMATATSNCPLDTRIVIFGGYGCPFQSCHKMSDVYRSFRTSELSARSALGSSPVTSPSPSSIKDPPRSLQLLSSNAELNLPSSRMLPPRQNGMRRKAGKMSRCKLKKPHKLHCTMLLPTLRGCMISSPGSICDTQFQSVIDRLVSFWTTFRVMSHLGN